MSNKNLLQQGVETLKARADRPASRPDLVLVTGAPRTGTSLAQMVLCSANNVNPYISEAAPLYSLVKSTHETLNHFGRFPQDYFNSETDMRSVLAQEYDLFFDACKHRYNAGTLVFKSPAMAPFLPTLFQTARQHICTLVMVRDPFQTLSSLLRWRDLAAAAGQPTIYSGVPVSVLAKHIVRHYGFVMDLVLPASKHVKFCKFETLLSQPTETQKDWENWCGLKGMNYAGNKDVGTMDGAFSHTEYFGGAISKEPLSHALHPDVLAAKGELGTIFYTYCKAFGYENVADEAGAFLPTDSLNRVLNQDLKVNSAVGKTTTKMVQISNEVKSVLLQKAGATKQMHVDRYANLMTRFKAQAGQNKEIRKAQQSTIAALKASIASEKKKLLKQQQKNAGLHVKQKAQSIQIKETRKLVETHKRAARKIAQKHKELRARLDEQVQLVCDLRKQVALHKGTAQKFAKKYTDLRARLDEQVQLVRDLRKQVALHKGTAQKFAKKYINLRAKFNGQAGNIKELRQLVILHKSTAQKFARKYADLLLGMELQGGEEQMAAERNDHDKA